MQVARVAEEARREEAQRELLAAEAAAREAADAAERREAEERARAAQEASAEAAKLAEEAAAKAEKEAEVFISSLIVFALNYSLFLLVSTVFGAPRRFMYLCLAVARTVDIIFHSSLLLCII